MAVTLNTTTLAAAMTDKDGVISLVSGATVVAGQMAYVDREAMLFLAPVGGSTTLWYVQRGYSGTPATAHIIAANVKTGPQGYFYMNNPSGAANANTEVALPHVNVLTGDVFDVVAGVWKQIGTSGVAAGTPAWP